MKKIKRNLDCNKAFKIHIAKNLNEFKLEVTKNHLKLENSLENLTDGSKNLILKEEMNEKHLQEAINHKSAIPVPDIVEIEAADYDKLYPPDCVIPKIRIMIQPKNEVIEYDADSEDDEWLKQDAEALKLTYDNFEKYMEYLENALALTKKVPALNELINNFKTPSSPLDIIATYDYWVNKRIKINGAALMYSIKQDTPKSGIKYRYDPYVAFRPCRERMRLRKNRARDYENYIKMLAIREKIEDCVKFYKTHSYCESTKHELLKLRYATFLDQYLTKGFNSSYLEKEALCNTEFLLKDLKENRIGNDLSRNGDQAKEAIQSSKPMNNKEEEEDKFEFRRIGGCGYHQINNDFIPANVNDKFFSTDLGMMRRRMGRGGRIIYDRISNPELNAAQPEYEEVDFCNNIVVKLCNKGYGNPKETSTFNLVATDEKPEINLNDFEVVCSFDE